MPAFVVDEEEAPFDPDDLKMPESPGHRRTVDLIALAAARLLGPEHEIFRDMDWYPPDGGNALAPDLMVLPVGAMPANPGAQDPPVKSYRQDQTGGPPPSVVVEVPSGSDGFIALRVKARRCLDLGATVYLVIADPPGEVLRLVPGRAAQTPWTGRPIPELGGLRVDVIDGQLTVITPDGIHATSDEDLTAQIEARARARAEEAEARAEEAEARAEEAEARADALARRLRELGIDPGSAPPQRPGG